MYTDPSGEGILLSLIIGTIISGAVIYGTVSGVNAYNDGARGWELAGSIIFGGVVGGLTGGFIGASLGAGFGLAGLGGGALAIAFIITAEIIKVCETYNKRNEPNISVQLIPSWLRIINAN